MTLCQLVKELKGIPLYILGNSLQEKIKCHPNYNSFEIWKGSFQFSVFNSFVQFSTTSELLLSSSQGPSGLEPCLGLYPRADY
jgi:hypothetical protein